MRAARENAMFEIRIPERLEARVAKAARRAGATPRAFVLEAIAEKVEREQPLTDFERVAEDRYSRVVANGETIPWRKMRSYLEGRASGKTPKRPASRRISK